MSAPQVCSAPAAYGADYYRLYLEGDHAWRRALKSRAYLYRALLKAVRRHQAATTTVVEVGCGAGFMSALLTTLPGGPQVLSGDRSAAATGIVRRALGPHPGLGLCRTDAEALPYRERSADLLVCLDVVEHLAAPRLFLEEAHRVLRPGGLLLFSTPNPASLGARLKGGTPRAVGRPPAERLGEWFGHRDDSHVSVHPVARWRDWARETGFGCLKDGTDFWWDTPYLHGVPLALQKALFNGSHHVLFRLFGFLPWPWGENYYGLWRRA